MKIRRTGLVSVILVNFRGADDTIACVRGLREMDWPAERLQIVCVDNDSGDDSVARIQAADPDVLLVPAKENLGFAGGCNLGAARSSGEYIAFLNNDARPDAAWLRAAMGAFTQAPDVGAVASKVLDWDGRRIDYVGGSVTWFGMGYKPDCDRLDDGSHDEPANVLFATGAATVMRADVFDIAGGFDERYFMFFEDVDLGWRLNLLGWKVRYEPASVAYHRQHASMAAFGDFREMYLLERNALFTLYKNLDDRSLERVLPGALLLAVRRAVLRGGRDSTELDLRRPGGDDRPSEAVSKQTLAGLYAIDQLATQIGALTADRRQIQLRRRVSDAELRPLFGNLLEELHDLPGHREAHADIVSALGIEPAARKRRIVIITGDVIAKAMAGPAIRAWNFATHLSREHDVRLLTSASIDVWSPDFEVLAISREDPRSADSHVDWCDVVVFQGHAMAEYRALQVTDKPMVVDLYDPMHLEQLEQARERGPQVWTREVESATEVLNQQIRRGDFFLCASERQRHFWLGQFAALGRINPLNYAADNSMTSLLALVPFGMPAADPVRTGPGMRGVVPGIEDGDKVIIWGGGIYNWFDPLSLIRAVDLLRRDHPRVRLFFLGMQHPNPLVPKMQMAAQARELSESLGLTGRHVFFNEKWVPYDDRQNYLMDADVGVSTHFEHIETTFSFRTRILDYLWAGLPIVTTRGDGFGDLVAEQGMGVAVPESDPVALAEALGSMLFDTPAADRARANVARVRQDFTWDRTLAPLIAFCRDPRPAPDRVPPATDTPGAPPGTARRFGAQFRKDLYTTRRHLAELGLSGTLAAASARVRRTVAARRRPARG